MIGGIEEVGLIRSPIRASILPDRCGSRVGQNAVMHNAKRPALMAPRARKITGECDRLHAIRQRSVASFTIMAGKAKAKKAAQARKKERAKVITLRLQTGNGDRD
jgi:hypothetical protein